jgi:DNA polymerase I-like protein with 3'-5' exonuclease and polymerase domains
VDLDKLSAVERWAVEEETAALARVHRETGVTLTPKNLNRKEILVQVLKTIGVVPRTTPSGQAMVDKVLLQTANHPVTTALLRARQMDKLRSTFVQSVRAHLVGDRLHCTFNQLRRTKEDGDDRGARFGRTSSEHPNLQQQPSRGDFASRWRSIYVPDEPSQRWLRADYNQQEPRMLTHYAELLGLPSARRMADAYRDDPTTDNHGMVTQWIYADASPGDENWKPRRDRCKTIYLGLCYGMGGAKLSSVLGLPTKSVYRNGNRQVIAGDEAQVILDQFNRVVPYVKELYYRCQEVAEKRGYIRTILGRLCHFPEREDGARDWTHKAINRLIQGSSADQIKRAMVEIDRAGLPLQLQVHDEVDTSVDDDEQPRRIKEIMETCIQLTVPSRVDLEIGPSWGEAKRI